MFPLVIRCWTASVNTLQAAIGGLLIPADPAAESSRSPVGTSGLYTTSTSHSGNSEPALSHAYASAARGGHYAELSLAAQAAVQPVANSHTRQSAELTALIAHCRTVFETNPIIRSNIDRRFNAEYQDLHDKVPRSNLQIEQRELDLNATLDAFRQFSELVSELIILQQQLPADMADMRIIKASSDLGGHAGGEKFKVGHVVFKFARDWENIYGAFVGGRASGYPLWYYTALFIQIQSL